jgi:RNA polymerase sigma-70 factor (ECF subfamily)
MLFFWTSVLGDKQRMLVEKLFGEKHGFSCAVSRRIVGPDEESQDIVSSAFIKLMENVGRYSSLSEDKLIALCVTIVKHKSYDLLRRQSKLMASDCPEGEISDTGYSLEEEIVYGDEVRRLRTLIQSLSYDEKRIVQMHYALGMIFKDIGMLMGISEEAAKKRCQRKVNMQRKAASPLRISLTIARKTCISNY